MGVIDETLDAALAAAGSTLIRRSTERCAVGGCSAPHAEDNDRCAPHDEDRRIADAAWAAKGSRGVPA